MSLQPVGYSDASLDVCVSIFSKLNVTDLLHVGQVCRSWLAATKNPRLALEWGNRLIKMAKYRASEEKEMAVFVRIAQITNNARITFIFMYLPAKLITAPCLFTTRSLQLHSRRQELEQLMPQEISDREVKISALHSEIAALEKSTNEEVIRQELKQKEGLANQRLQSLRAKYLTEEMIQSITSLVK